MHAPMRCGDIGACPALDIWLPDSPLFEGEEGRAEGWGRGTDGLACMSACMSKGVKQQDEANHRINGRASLLLPSMRKESKAAMLAHTGPCPARRQRVPHGDATR
jgi:hypothetical protein